jgi:CBS domain containing-hemolysin-like protein
MITLIVVVIALVGISFICSILEAVILSITRSYIQVLVDRKNRSGKILEKLKKNIEEPIAAILTLNTISHTVGAAISGALALQIFGSRWMALFSAVLTLLILIFSEIIPKTMGAHLWKRLGPISAYSLKTMVWLMKPIIIPIHLISQLFSRDSPEDLLSKGEILNTIRLAYRQRVIQPQEFEIMENLFKLHSIRVKDIMTPRSVVFSLPPADLIADTASRKIPLEFSRIPLYSPATNSVEGVVMRRDIMRHRSSKDTMLESLAKPTIFVPETISVYRLLNQLIENKIHLAVVVDEFGDFTGIVTMEDAIETLLGREIVDEYDRVADMRKLARQKSGKHFDQQTSKSK